MAEFWENDPAEVARRDEFERRKHTLTTEQIIWESNRRNNYFATRDFNRDAMLRVTPIAATMPLNAEPTPEEMGFPKENYSLKDIVTGLVGEGDNTTNVINNFLSSNGSPINIRKHFFDVLESWEAVPPLNSLWVVFFKVPDIVTDDAMAAWGEHIIGITGSESVDLARGRLLTDKFQKTVGCAFAQTVQIPQEQINMERVGIQNMRGFVPTPIITTRQQFASVNIEFLETNISFVDFLMRPWAILGSHFGSIARGPGKVPGSEKERPISLSTDMLVINLSRAGFKPKVTQDSNGEHVIENDRGFIPRKIWIFHGCQPVTIDSQRFTYSTDTTVERRNVEFMFKRYQVYLPSKMESLFAKVDKEEGGRGSQMAKSIPAAAAKNLHAGVIKEIKSRAKFSHLKARSNVYNYWGSRDGSRNIYDNPDLVGGGRGDTEWRGDMTLRRVARDKGSSWTKVNSNAKEDAVEYWRRGNDRLVTGSKWTVDRGKEIEPPAEFETSKGTAGVGTIRTTLGAPRLVTQQEPRGHLPEVYDDGGDVQDTIYSSSLHGVRQEAKRYASGDAGYNKNLNRATSGGGFIRPANPLRSSNARQGLNVRTGDKFIVTDSIARYRIKPSGNYAYSYPQSSKVHAVPVTTTGSRAEYTRELDKPSTGRTDLLRLIFGV